jgi:hypothetical protein
LPFRTPRGKLQTTAARTLRSDSSDPGNFLESSREAERILNVYRRLAASLAREDRARAFSLTSPVWPRPLSCRVKRLSRERAGVLARRFHNPRKTGAKYAKKNLAGLKKNRFQPARGLNFAPLSLIGSWKTARETLSTIPSPPLQAPSIPLETSSTPLQSSSGSSSGSPPDYRQLTSNRAPDDLLTRAGLAPDALRTSACGSSDPLEASHDPDIRRCSRIPRADPRGHVRRKTPG